MFRVRGSSIFKVLEGPKIDEFRDRFRKGSEARFGEALFAILTIFWCPLGSKRTPIGRKKDSFLRSEISMHFGSKHQSILGGVGGMGGDCGRFKDLQSLQK